MATVVFCGVIIYLAWRLISYRPARMVVQFAAAAIVIGICFSRIYSGAHWPSDVLGGYLWGAFYTGAIVLLFHRVQPRSTTDRLSSAGQLSTAG